jgi:hypothetical protein
MKLLEMTREFFQHAGRETVVKTGSVMIKVPEDSTV